MSDDEYEFDADIFQVLVNGKITMRYTEPIWKHLKSIKKIETDIDMVLHCLRQWDLKRTIMGKCIKFRVILYDRDITRVIPEELKPDLYRTRIRNTY